MEALTSPLVATIGSHGGKKWNDGEINAAYWDGREQRWSGEGILCNRLGHSSYCFDSTYNSLASTNFVHNRY